MFKSESIHDIESIVWTETEYGWYGELKLSQDYSLDFMAGGIDGSFPKRKMAFPDCYGELVMCLSCRGALVPIDGFLRQVLLDHEVRSLNLDLTVWGKFAKNVHHRTAYQIVKLVAFIIDLMPSTELIGSVNRTKV